MQSPKTVVTTVISANNGTTAMENDTKFLIRKVLIDVILLMCVGFPILFFFLWGPTYKRGFFCDDESIRHPFYTSTVPSYYLYIFGLFVPITVMCITEYVQCRRFKNERKLVFLNLQIPMWVFSAYCAIGVFAFGAACSQLTTDVMKYSIGRLRPHFYTVCQPNVNCTINQHKYITDFTCTNPLYVKDARIMKEMRLSFPSGHSSFSMYAMFYFALYLQARMTWRGSKLLRPALQYLAILASIYTGMSRISDYKHHWSDVLSGFAIGLFVAILIGIFVSDLFPRRKRRTYPLMIDDVGEENELNNLNGNNKTRNHV